MIWYYYSVLFTVLFVKLHSGILAQIEHTFLYLVNIYVIFLRYIFNMNMQLKCKIFFPQHLNNVIMTEILLKEILSNYQRVKVQEGDFR